MEVLLTQQIEQEFAYVDSIITTHTNAAVAKVNAEALQTYWEVGQFVSERLKSSAWGDHIVSELADYLTEVSHPYVVMRIWLEANILVTGGNALGPATLPNLCLEGSTKNIPPARPRRYSLPG